MATGSAVQLLLPDGRAMRCWARISHGELFDQVICSDSSGDTIASWKLGPQSLVGLAKSRPRCVSVKSVDDLVVYGAKMQERGIEFVGGSAEIIDKWVVSIAASIDRSGNRFTNNMVGSKVLSPVQKITVNSGEQESKRMTLGMGEFEGPSDPSRSSRMSMDEK